MIDFLLDPPLYIPVGLLIAGFVLFYSGLSRGTNRMKNAGVAVMGVGILIFIAGKFVETGPEKVSRLTDEFASAVDKRDWKRFADLLDPNVKFDIYSNREFLVAGAKLSVDRVGVKNVSTGGYEVQSEPGGYNVAFTATADIELSGRRTPTNWKFFWAKAETPDGFQIYRIDVLPSPGGIGTDAVTERLAKPK